MMRRALAFSGLAACASFLPAGTAHAQFPLEIVAGPTFTNIATDDFDTSSKTGFFVGVGTAFQLNERFAIQPYVGYVQKGATFTADDGEDTYSYIEIPVMLTTGFPVSESVMLGVGAGPQVSINLTCNETIPGEPDFDCKEYEDYVGGTDFGVLGTVGLFFPMGNSMIGVGGGIDLGLKDIFEDIDGGYKNRGFFLSVSYGMTIGGS